MKQAMMVEFSHCSYCIPLTWLLGPLNMTVLFPDMYKIKNHYAQQISLNAIPFNAIPFNAILFSVI